MTRWLYQCRRCQALNDFDGITAEIQRDVDEEHPPTAQSFHFAVLAVYTCAACGFTVEPEPGWIFAPPDEGVGPESGFSRVKVEES
jgi:hypothetical protein